MCVIIIEVHIIFLTCPDYYKQLVFFLLHEKKVINILHKTDQDIISEKL